MVAATLWPDDLDADARANLRRHLHRLRSALPAAEGGDWIRDEGGRVGWNHAAAAFVDVAAFAALIGEPARRAEAVALYEGDLLDGVDEEWLAIERERLRAAFVDGALGLAAAQRRERDFAAAASSAERVLAHDDLREDALRELIAARYESGERTTALATFERFAGRLRDALGVDPMPETVALVAAIRARMPIADEESIGVAVPEGWQPAFAGRDGELDTLRRAWTRAARGAGTTFFVGGEAGIGKSRLISELARIVRAQGGRVVLGATSDPEGEPYQALLVAMRRGLPFVASAGDDAASLAPLARVLPELRMLRLDVPPDEDASDDAARTRLFAALGRFVERLALTRPLLLVLEDLHWAGEATVAALAAIARRAGSLPVLIVASYRAEEAGAAHPLRAVRAQLSAEHRAGSLSLRRLDARAVVRMLDLAELVDAPPEFAAAVHRVSDGNPLFVAQLARAFVETKELPGERAPLAIGDAITARVARLDPRARAVGEVAAALGETFSVDAVRDVGGWDEGWVLDGLGELMDAAMVRETGTARYGFAFTHALVASAMYAATPEGLRAARHRRIARLLERRTGGDRGALETIARHWRLADDHRNAATAYVRAASAALAVFARSEAIAFARLAYELAGDDRTRFEALKVAASAPVRTADLAGWDEDLTRIETVAERLGNDELFVALSLRELQLYQLGRREEERAVVARMVTLAESGLGEDRRAVAYDAQGMLLLAEGDLSGSAAVLRTAFAAAVRAGSASLTARSRMHLMQALVRLGAHDEAFQLLSDQRTLLAHGATFEERLSFALAKSSLAFAGGDGPLIEEAGTEMLQLALHAGDADVEGKSRAMLAYAAHLRNDSPAAREQYDRAVAIYDRAGNGAMQGIVRINRGILEAEVGRLDDAFAMFEAALPYVEAAGSRIPLGYLLAERADCELLAGDARSAAATAGAAREIGVATGERRLLARSLGVLGAAQAASGDPPAALESLRAAVEHRRATNEPNSLADDLALLIDALLDVNDVNDANGASVAAAELSQLIAGRPERQKHPMRIGRALAREARVRGDGAAAAAVLAAARALFAERVRLLGSDGDAYRDLPFNRERAPGAAAAAAR